MPCQYWRAWFNSVTAADDVHAVLMVWSPVLPFMVKSRSHHHTHLLLTHWALLLLLVAAAAVPSAWHVCWVWSPFSSGSSLGWEIVPPSLVQTCHLMQEDQHDKVAVLMLGLAPTAGPA